MSEANHSHCALSLAHMMLPKSGYYNKFRIMELLLIHDIAEATRSERVISSKKETAISRISQKLSVLGYNKSFLSADAWSDMLKEYNEKLALEAKIASNIEAIETYLQASEYILISDQTISDIDDWFPSILTIEGCNILKLVKYPAQRAKEEQIERSPSK